MGRLRSSRRGIGFLGRTHQSTAVVSTKDSQTLREWTGIRWVLVGIVEGFLPHDHVPLILTTLRGQISQERLEMDSWYPLTISASLRV